MLRQIAALGLPRPPPPTPRSQYVLHLGRGEFGAGTGMLDALCFVSLKKRVIQLQ